LWVYGNTDLADFYAGRLTLRQIKVRLLSLPHEPPNRAPTWDALLADQEKSDERRKVTEVEDVLARFKS
jgi:hypothetical protein